MTWREGAGLASVEHCEVVYHCHIVTYVIATALVAMGARASISNPDWAPGN